MDNGFWNWVLIFLNPLQHSEPEDLEEEELKKDMKALEDQDEGQRINAFNAVKVKTESEV